MNKETVSGTVPGASSSSMQPPLLEPRFAVPLEFANTAPSPLAVSVVVPCYKSEEGLRELHRRTALACHSIAGENYEIILVDDGSADGTWSVIRELANQDPHIVGMKL